MHHDLLKTTQLGEPPEQLYIEYSDQPTWHNILDLPPPNKIEEKQRETERIWYITSYIRSWPVNWPTYNLDDTPLSRHLSKYNHWKTTVHDGNYPSTKHVK